jgi:hypothetical protein
MEGQRDHDTIDVYRIRVRGHLDQRWTDWFDGFEMAYHDKNTILTGHVADQAALHGLLAKIRDLGLTILLVENFADEVEDGEVS